MTNIVTGRVIRTDISMAVVAREGGLHLLFSEQNQVGESVPAYTANFLLSAGDALTLSTLLADLAFEVDTGLKPAGDVVKAELIERHRIKLVNRVALQLGTLRERKTVTHRKLAATLVDTMLHEVFT